MPFYCHQQNINLNASDVMSRNCSALALSASYNNVLQYCVYLVFFFCVFTYTSIRMNGLAFTDALITST